MKTRLRVKVVPGASRSGITGWLGEELKVRVAAPPEKGKANKAVIKTLSDALHLPAATFRIISGTTSPHKVVEVADLTENCLKELLNQIITD